MLEREPKFESTARHGHDLFELTSKEKQALQERIEKWQGLVRIFVHPMYEKWRGNESEYINDPDNQKLVQIEEVLSKLLAMPENKTPPIVIMEERVFIKELEKWLKENSQGSSQEGVYFVKTCRDDPTPKLRKITTDPWKLLTEILRGLGVRKILIGGMQLGVLWHKKDWTQKDPFLERCVGIAISHLSKDKGGEFEVELSALTHPTNERESFISYQRSNNNK
ncbi:MAG: hypothetical protein US18_C0021G0004 [Parcubacteria group bacterium GW2011_GWB1_36_5]|nr:MAG: hypothetical protein US12_C0008G0004 [Parcubacteria group bacterium GW2011_GWA2_36_24]KKQ07272.1 MAG: hypothetical protein US18_C0021G0004 [Parcubacteria group bacterium GW2011_GWB1_36_5]